MKLTFQILDKLLPPPGEGIDDEVAVGKFYATVLIQVNEWLSYFKIHSCNYKNIIGNNQKIN